MTKVLSYLKYAAGYAALSLFFLIIQAFTELLLPSMMATLVDEGIVALNGKESQMTFILTEGVKMLAIA